MRIFGRELSAAFHLTERGEDVLVGLDITQGICEHCGNPVTVTRLGIGFGELDIFLQEGH